MKKTNSKLSQAQNGISTSKTGISTWLGWEMGKSDLSLTAKF